MKFAVVSSLQLLPAELNILSLFALWLWQAGLIARFFATSAVQGQFCKQHLVISFQWRWFIRHSEKHQNNFYRLQCWILNTSLLTHTQFKSLIQTCCCCKKKKNQRWQLNNKLKFESKLKIQSNIWFFIVAYCKYATAREYNSKWDFKQLKWDYICC